MTVLSGLHPLAVGAVGSVDGDLLALVDEQGDHHLGARLEGHFLEGAGRCRVALDGRLGVGDLQLDVGRKLAGKALLLRLDDEHHLDMLALFHKVGILDYVVRKMDLLICLFVHEVESVLVAIKELVGTTFDVDGLDLCTGGESVFENAAVFEVTEFGLDESGALAGFDMLEPYDHTRLTVEIEVEAVFEISCCCHINIY